ncbi:MAG: TIGR02466 family protein [Pseudomonadota bacterium]
MSQTSLISAFSTPIANVHWKAADSLNDALRSSILDRMEAQPVQRSNVGGWHSDQDLLEWPDSSVATFSDRLWAVIHSINQSTFEDGKAPLEEQMRIDAWANVLMQGGYNSVHAHPNALWSGVYYVTDNESIDDHPFSGKLELLDPRPATSVAFAESMRVYGRFLVNPIAGQLVVFPSWLQHCVHPYFGHKQRIAIAFNVVVLT